MSTFTALYDACVLYPAPLRDLLMRLALTDLFRAHLLDLNPAAVCSAAKSQRAALKNPPKTVDEFLEALAKQRLPETVSRLREFSDLI